MHPHTEAEKKTIDDFLALMTIYFQNMRRPYLRIAKSKRHPIVVGQVNYATQNLKGIRWMRHMNQKRRVRAPDLSELLAPTDESEDAA